MRYLPLIALTLALVSCSSSGDDESSFCDDQADLQSSFQDLRDVNVADDGITALDEAIDAVVADAEALRASVPDLEPEIDAFTSSVQDLQTSVASAPNPAEQATAAVDGLSTVSIAWDALEQAGAECD